MTDELDTFSGYTRNIVKIERTSDLNRSPLMQPFKVSSNLDPLTDTYPSAVILVNAIKTGDRDACCAIARLWLSEGIPFAFKDKPAIYEALRIWSAQQLNVQAKEITIIGSARQGYSLSPDQNVGRPFSPQSDLDMTVVSERLFRRLRGNFERWAQDYSQGLVQPRHEREMEFWNKNLHNCLGNLGRGFIDPHKIPTRNSYADVQFVMNTIWRISEKLKLTPQAPNVRKVSIRVYQDWDSFVRQMAVNLEYLGRVSKKLLATSKMIA